MSKCVDIELLTEAIETIPWYHIGKKGGLVSGASSEEDGLYKAKDVYRVLEKAPVETDLVRCGECVNEQTCPLAQRLGESGYCSEGERK